ncbi:flavin reductase [Rhizobium sp. SYY.PMSO]|uniref:flavin reductase n=1 Tax=Rhizobium sp. SYY.PMSO TaxID=3382192 RepID=UPI00398FD04C
MPRSGHFTDIQEDVTVSLQAFRDGMSRLGAAVNVITSNGPCGRLGFTATAVCSISDTPPSLLVCMNRRSLQNGPIRQNGVFCVNTLSAGQQDLSGVFSGVGKLEMDDRFTHGKWATLETGSPVLVDAIVSFDCRIVQALEVNTHTLMIAEVLAVKNGSRATSLIYLNRRYHELHPET